MDAVIHIGTEKTGTKTIQEFLFQNRSKLLNKNIIYPTTLGLKDNRKLAAYCMDSHNIDDYIKLLGIISVEKRGRWKKNLHATLKNELLRLEGSASKVIFSSEHLQSRLNSLHEIQTLYDLLEPYFNSIKILLYLRRQDQVAVSLYSTMCRAGGTRVEVLPKKADSNSAYYNYYNLVKKWETIFGKSNIDIRIYDKDKFIGGDLLNDFIFTCGIEYRDNYIIPLDMNKRLSKNMQKLLIIYNRFFPRFIDDKPSVFNNQLRDFIIHELADKYGNTESLPTKEEAIKFYNTFRQSNIKLADEYLSKKELFSEDFSKYPDKIDNDNLPEEIFVDILRLFAKYMERFYLVPKNELNTYNIKNIRDIIYKHYTTKHKK